MNRSNSLSLVGALALLSGITLHAEKGWADSFQQTLSAQASEEHVTNPLLRPADQGLSAWRTTVQPKYVLEKVVGVNTLQANLGLMLVRSSNTNLIADRSNPTASLSWHRQQTRGQFDISTTYSKASTLLTEPSTAGLVSANSTSTARDVSAKWSRSLSERSTLALNGAYKKTDYSGTALNTNLSDHTTESGGLNYSYALNEHTVPFVEMSYVHSKFGAVGITAHQYSALLGVNWTVSDRLKWSFQGGASRLERAGSNTTSSQGGATVDYQSQLTNLTLAANRQYQPSGLGSFILVDQVNGKLSHEVGERNTVGLNAGWVKSNYLTGTQHRSEEVWFHHDLSPSWGIKVYFQHRTGKQPQFATATSNMAGISIACARF